MAIMVTEETDEVTSIYPEIGRIVRMECLLKYLDGEERAFCLLLPVKSGIRTHESAHQINHAATSVHG